MWSRLTEVQLGQTKCVINLHLSGSCLVSPTISSRSASTTHIVTFSRSHKHSHAESRSCRLRCRKCRFIKRAERVWLVLFKEELQLSLLFFKSTSNRFDRCLLDFPARIHWKIGFHSRKRVKVKVLLADISCLLVNQCVTKKQSWRYNMEDKSDTYMNNQSLPKQHKCCSVPATKHSVW